MTRPKRELEPGGQDARGRRGQASSVARQRQRMSQPTACVQCGRLLVYATADGLCSRPWLTCAAAVAA